MTDTFRAMCAELLQGLDENRHPEVRYPGHLRIIMDRARTLLAQPEPEGLTDEELQQHPITSPPDELVEKWITEIWREGTPVRVAASDLHIATQSAQWGWDQRGAAADRTRILLAQPVPAELTDEALTMTYAYAVAAAVGNRRGPYQLEDAEAAQLAGLRAAIAADRARRLTPQPPADGEVAALVERLKSVKQNDNTIPTVIRWGLRDGTMHHHRIPVTNEHASDCDRAADILERLASDNAGLEAAAESAYLDNLSLLDSQDG